MVRSGGTRLNPLQSTRGDDGWPIDGAFDVSTQDVGIRYQLAQRRFVNGYDVASIRSRLPDLLQVLMLRRKSNYNVHVVAV